MLVSLHKLVLLVLVFTTVEDTSVLPLPSHPSDDHNSLQPPPAPLPQPEDLLLTDIFNNTRTKYPCFKSPALLYTTTGRLLAFAEGRGGVSSGGCGQEAKDSSEVVLLRSDDRGKTWLGNLTVVHTGFPGEAMGKKTCTA